MIKIEIRMAETGHSEKICVDAGCKGQTIYSHINNVYKILPKDQLVISKIGHVIKEEQQLKRQLSELRGDQTLGSNYISEQQINNNGLISCIYFFNLKEFSSAERMEAKSAQYWRNELQEKLRLVKNLRPVVSQLLPVQKLIGADKIKQFDKMVRRVSGLRRQLMVLEDRCLNLKEVQLKIQQIIERCNNQKNSSVSLFKSLQSFFDEKIIKPMSEFAQTQKQLQASLATNSNHLRQNSSFFQNKKNMQQSTKLYQERMKDIKVNFERDKADIKKQVKKGKSKFRPVDEAVTQFGKSSMIKKIEQGIQANKDHYNAIMTAFKQLTQAPDYKPSAKLQSDIDSLERLIKDHKEVEIGKCDKMLKLKYLQFSELNQQNMNHIKSVYEAFLQMKNKFIPYQEGIAQLQKDISEELRKNQQKNNRPSFMSDDAKGRSVGRDYCERQNLQLSISSEIEFNRRICFNRRINFVHSFIDKMCAQEEQLRKRYIANCKKQGHLQRIFLRNAKVPFVDVDYNGTTDLDVVKSSKSSKSSQLHEGSITIEEFLILEYSQMVDLVNSIRKEGQSMKVDNMMEIIKRMSDIFGKVYNKKYNQLQQNSTKLVETIGNLEESMTKLEKDAEQQEVQKGQLRRSIQEQQQIIAVANDSLSQQKNRSQRLNIDSISLKRDLKKQTQINNTLCEQIAILQEQCQNSKRQLGDLKVLLAVKQVQICRLQQYGNQQLKEQSNQLNNEVLGHNQMDLKSIVMKEFNTDAQVRRLSQQVAYLQSQKEQLQQQNATLQAEMRKIIIRETQDIQIQTQSLQTLSQSKPKEECFHNEAGHPINDRITIQQQITVGQNALFIPFDNNQYVGVQHKDEARTLCNMNNLYPSSYILDSSLFHRTTKQLLSQCSFLLVVKVTSIRRQDKKSFVQGKIRYMFGFEDDSTMIKDYAGFLPPQ